MNKLTYTREIADAICDRLAAGESLKSVCRLEGFPAESTVRLWAQTDHDGFRDRFELARNIGIEGLLDMMVGIAGKDYSIIENGVKKVDNAAVSQARLMIDTIKWKASKQMPAKYGDRVVAEITGRDGGPVEVEAIRSGLVERITRIAHAGAIEGTAGEREQARIGADRGGLETDDQDELSSVGDRGTSGSGI